MIRNKTLLCSLIAGLTLCLGACGQNDASEDSNQITAESFPAEENEASADSETAEEDSASQKEETGGNLQAEAGSDTDSLVVLTFTEDADTDTAEDGTELYTSTCSYPTVEITAHPEAAELINADIMERVNAFKSNSQIRQTAKEDYELYPEYFHAYGDWLYMGAPRADADVISVIMEYISYSGGAHDSLVDIAVNYDPNTGAILSFSDLSEDPEQFHISTLEYNQKTAATEEYAERLFTTDSITNGELENVLYAEEKWYFSEEGLVFISDPYMLGPWAAGTIEFTIPYEDLVALGMKEIYSRPGMGAEIINLEEDGQ